jgi:metal-dependent hydrolase (beta-lactamase superfamily II)
MDKLLALPVAGDSYLLDLHGRKILVDGGHSSRSLRTALSSPNVAVTELDIVVCTHADADHAGGLVDLLGGFKSEVQHPGLQ